MGGSSQDAGFRYFMGAEFVIVQGPVDSLSAIDFADRRGFTGDVTDTGNVDISELGLFGGEEREGGVSGICEIRMGKPDQLPDPYVEAKSGTIQPGNRGLLSLVFRGRIASEFVVNPLDDAVTAFGRILSRIALGGQSGFYWAAQNPYIKTLAVTVRRILKGWSTPVWYPEKARIGDGMNPVHIIYQCITDNIWGIGRPSALINDTSFRAAADVLFAEDFGLSLILTQQTRMSDFIREVERHVDAALDVDDNGQYIFTLIRNNYDINTLPIFDPSNILEMSSFNRNGWDETINEVTVKYTNPITNQAEPVTVQDLANIQIQGSVVTSTNVYAGVRLASVAAKLAERDLHVMATPLAHFTFTTNRDAAFLFKGAPIKVTWPAQSLSNLVCRVIDIDKGSLHDGKISITAIEDVFATPTSSYLGTQGSTWVNPAGAPSVVNTVLATEVPYFSLQRSVPADVLHSFIGTDAFPLILAERPAVQNTRFQVYSSPDSSFDPITNEGAALYTPTALLAGNIDRFATVLPYGTLVGSDPTFFVGGYFKLGNEWCALDDADSTTLTVRRGCLDSIPEAHVANEKIWFYADALKIDAGGFADLDGDHQATETVYYRETGRGASGETPLSTAPQQALVLTGDWIRPYPPANVKLDGNYYPASCLGNFVLTWGGRDRIAQISDLIGWTEDSILPEPGVTYTLRLYDDDLNALIFVKKYMTVGLTGGTYSHPGGGPATHYRFEFFAVRGQIESKLWTHTCEAIGNDVIGPPPVSDEHTSLTFIFGGTFSVGEGTQIVVNFEPAVGFARVNRSYLLDSTGKSSLDDYAIELAGLVDADFPAVVNVARTGATVVIDTNDGTLTGYAQPNAVNSNLLVRQEPQPSTQGVSHIVSFDLYEQLANGQIELAPANSEKYLLLGLSLTDFDIFGLTYDINESLNFGVHSGIDFSVAAGNGQLSNAMGNLLEQLRIAKHLTPYRASVSWNLYSGTDQERTQITLVMKSGYYIGETWNIPSAWGTHPSGFGVGIKKVVQGVQPFPNGAKKKVEISWADTYASGGIRISTRALGQVFTVTLDSIVYSHTVDATDVADDPFLDALYTDLKAQIDADNLYNVVPLTGLSSDDPGVPHIIALTIQRKVANTDFTVAVTTSYGLQITVISA